MIVIFVLLSFTFYIVLPVVLLMSAQKSLGNKRKLFLISAYGIFAVALIQLAVPKIHLSKECQGQTLPMIGSQFPNLLVPTPLCDESCQNNLKSSPGISFIDSAQAKEILRSGDYKIPASNELQSGNVTTLTQMTPLLPIHAITVKVFEPPTFTACPDASNPNAQCQQEGALKHTVLAGYTVGPSSLLTAVGLVDYFSANSWSSCRID